MWPMARACQPLVRTLRWQRAECVWDALPASLGTEWARWGRGTPKQRGWRENDITYHLLRQVTNLGIYPKSKAKPAKCYNQESMKTSSYAHTHTHSLTLHPVSSSLPKGSQTFPPPCSRTINHQISPYHTEPRLPIWSCFLLHSGKHPGLLPQDLHA